MAKEKYKVRVDFSIDHFLIDLTSGTTEASAESLHGGGLAAAHVADHQVLPEALHDHAPSRLHGGRHVVVEGCQSNRDDHGTEVCS